MAAWIPHFCCVTQDPGELTTPSAALRWLRDIFLMPQPPLLFQEGSWLAMGCVEYIDAQQAPFQGVDWTGENN